MAIGIVATPISPPYKESRIGSEFPQDAENAMPMAGNNDREEQNIADREEQNMAFQLFHGETVACTVLSRHYHLLAMSKSSLKEVALYHVFQLFFFEAIDSDFFFSFTETEDEISLVMDDRYEIPTTSMYSSVSDYRAIALHFGTGALDSIWFLREFIQPLAESDMDIVVLNTCNAGIVLVPNDQLDEAISRLQTCHSLLDDVLEIPATHHHSTDSRGSIDSVRNSPLLRRSSLEVGMIPMNWDNLHAKVDLTSIPGKLAICTLQARDIPRCAHAILRAFFYKPMNGNNTLCAFTVVNGEVTLVLDTDILHIFPDDTLQVHEQPWKAVRVSKGEVPMTESALVSEISEVLSHSTIPLSYLGTTAADFVLVECRNILAAVEALRRSLCISIHFDGR